MRTKIGKRIGPVPIVLAVAVFAVATLLAMYAVQPGISSAKAPPTEGGVALGVLGTPKCEIDLGNANDASPTLDLDSSADNLQLLVSGGACSTSGATLDVVFKNRDTNTAKQVVVITTGGSDYTLQAMTQQGEPVEDMDDTAIDETDPNSPAPIGKKGLDVKVIDVPEATSTAATGPADGKATLTLERGMAKDG